MRTLYDSVDAAAIPAGVQLVAGYVDGRYAWSAADWARFPGAPQVRIAVFATTNDGNCADVETGDMTPSTVIDWLKLRRGSGVDPTVYCGYVDWLSIQQLCADDGIAPPHHWLADWDGRQVVYAGDVAHQFANGAGYDTSVALDYWPGVDAPLPDPGPGPGGNDMTEQQVIAIIDRYLAADIHQGTSAQALMLALLARIGTAGKALSLDQPPPASG